ncbi:LOB domain-containing protein CRL1 [Camellia lanceoleosa]|uniref:LOB domain-containing protein CRL1 n=1 Tax=Camellia lanceoleosa TaxID=1840588 RepID=A0ACC0IDR4_9ERIC|nr:LOB domain-containing protein CRL1 [Camellia lanceoleosa]
MTGLGSSCGACKFLRRRSTSESVFAPYFNYNEAAAHFAVVHKVFGASNVSKLLTNLPMNDRREAAITISYEALTQMHDPIYGCVSQMFALQQQLQGASVLELARSTNHSPDVGIAEWFRMPIENGDAVIACSDDQSDNEDDGDKCQELDFDGNKLGGGSIQRLCEEEEEEKKLGWLLVVAPMAAVTAAAMW